MAPRMPGPSKDFVRGSINNRPFRPGGLQADDAEAAALEKAFRRVHVTVIGRMSL